jgi:hypothetical protein
MVMSELTGGVDGLGLLVFLMCSTYGRYIDPDLQGDSTTYPVGVSDVPSLLKIVINFIFLDDVVLSLQHALQHE